MEQIGQLEQFIVKTEEGIKDIRYIITLTILKYKSDSIILTYPVTKEIYSIPEDDLEKGIYSLFEQYPEREGVYGFRYTIKDILDKW
jgi:hypothetical protein